MTANKIEMQTELDKIKGEMSSKKVLQPEVIEKLHSAPKGEVPVNNNF